MWRLRLSILIPCRQLKCCDRLNRAGLFNKAYKANSNSLDYALSSTHNRELRYHPIWHLHWSRDPEKHFTKFFLWNI